MNNHEKENEKINTAVYDRVNKPIVDEKEVYKNEKKIK